MTGSLWCVGTGIRLAGQNTVINRSIIRAADRVFGIVPDEFVATYLISLNERYESLQPFYAAGKSRRRTYAEMIEHMLSEVRKGLTVCFVSYGHPGVFSYVGHQSIRQARDEGFDATMEPGISAEDCLYADLNIDPGATGCQQYEASQFMFYDHPVNPAALLILWQISIAGEHTLTRFDTTPERLQVLVEHLGQWYPADHEVTLYEAAFLPIEDARIERISLSDLPSARLDTKTTLVIPAAKALRTNPELLERLGLTANDLHQPDR